MVSHFTILFEYKNYFIQCIQREFKGEQLGKKIKYFFFNETFDLKRIQVMQFSDHTRCLRIVMSLIKFTFVEREGVATDQPDPILIGG